FLTNVAVPFVFPTFPERDEYGTLPLTVGNADVIIISQSCDLELNKIKNVVVAQVLSLDAFEGVNQSYKTKGRWKEVARGRVEALHMLPPFQGERNRDWIVVDFRSIFSLPFTYVTQQARAAGNRYRLQPPYLECLSQAFGRFFMRVALPIDPPDDFSPPAVQ